jgi:hypothetical protein
VSKSNITKLFVGSLIAVVGGLVVLLVGVWLASANSALIMSGSDVTGIESSPFAWSMVGLAMVGIIAMIGGAIGQFVAWIGAVINTAYLEDKTWFVLLLVLGLLSFGFVAMLIYVIAGPDGTKATRIARSAPGAVG